MEIKPEIYSQSNGLQLKDAFTLIQEYLVGNEGSVELAVDVGCGTGEVTGLLASHLKTSDQILAFDRDPQMVQFCKSSQAQKRKEKEAEGSFRSNVEYFQDDISLEWEDLSERLRRVEGQVDLVFANLVFHWISAPCRATAVTNILRLLKPGGKSRFILNILLFSPLDYCGESAAEKERIASFIKVPSFEEQELFWKQYFQSDRNPNMWTIQGHLSFKDWTDETTSLKKANAIREAFDAIVKGQMIPFQKFVIREMSSEDKGQFLNEIFDTLFSTYIAQVQEENGVIRSRVRYTGLELCGFKK